MTLTNKDILTSLLPLSLGGDFEADLTLEGQNLDSTRNRAKVLLAELLPDHTDELLQNWERVYDLNGSEKPISARRNAIIAKMRERGGQSIPYFQSLAEALEQTIEINEFQPARVGIARVGVSRVQGADVVFVWEVVIMVQHLYYARVGVTRVGDRIMWADTDDPIIEQLLLILKPAHTRVIFTYNPNLLFNGDFELGTLSGWDAGYSLIQSDYSHYGDYSCILTAISAAKLGAKSDAIEVDETLLYKIDSWHAVKKYAGVVAGVYAFYIMFYSDTSGTVFLSESIVYSNTVETTNFEEGLKIVGPASVSPDISFPVGTQSVRFQQRWVGGASQGSGYMDDITLRLYR